MGRRHTDLTAAVEEAWTQFRVRLADRLADISERVIILSVEVPEVDHLEGATPYVQFRRDGADGLVAEVTSNHYLDPRWALSAADEDLLTEIGWWAPTHHPDEDIDEGSPNFYVEAGLRDADRVALMAVRALREVLACQHPAFLILRGMGEPVAVPDGGPSASHMTGIEGAEDPLDHEGQEDAPAMFPRNSEELQDAVDRAVGAMFDAPLVHDDDGDIPILYGRSLVFVRVATQQPAVDLHCELVHEITDLARAAEEVAILNLSHPMARFHLEDGCIIARYRLHAVPFMPLQLRYALGQMSRGIDDLARDLALRVGGQRFTPSDDLPEFDFSDPAIPTQYSEAVTCLLELLQEGPVPAPLVAALFDNQRSAIVEDLATLRAWPPPEEHDLDEVIGHLRAAIRCLAERNAVTPRRRPLPPKPRRLRAADDTEPRSGWAETLGESGG